VRPSRIGKTFAPAEAQVTGPAFRSGQYSDVTLLSFGVLNGSANSGNSQGGIRLANTLVNLFEFTSNAQVRGAANYSDFTNTTTATVAHGVSTAGGVLALGLRHIRGATDGLAVFVNGRVLTTANAQNKSLAPGDTTMTAHWAGAAGNQGYLTSFNAFWSRALTDSEIASISANPWQLFSPERQLWSYEAGSSGGPQTLAATRFDNSPAFYAHSISQGGATQTLTATRLDNSPAFYAATVTPGSVALTATRFDNGQTFYSASISQAGGGPQTLTASRFDNAQTFYTHSLSVGSVTLTPSLFTNGQTFHAATVTQGAAPLFPSLLVNQQTFYSATLSGGIPLIRQKGLRKTRYTPGRVPSQQAELIRFLQSELERLNDALESPFTHQLLEKLNTEPSRKRDGYVAYADGTNWSPGGLGEGVYVYYAGIWNKLG
jgi:hypothetical protein